MLEAYDPISIVASFLQNSIESVSVNTSSLFLQTTIMDFNIPPIIESTQWHSGRHTFKRCAECPLVYDGYHDHQACKQLSTCEAYLYDEAKCKVRLPAGGYTVKRI